MLEYAELISGDALEEFFVVEHLYEAVNGGVAGLFGNGNRQVREGAHILVDTLEQGSAAGEDDPAIVDVGGNLGAKFRKRVLDPQGDAANDALDDRINFDEGDLNGRGTSGGNVTAATLNGFGDIVGGDASV